MTYKEFIDNILSTRGRYGIKSPEYYEVHHIMPKCLGGSDDSNNKIRLYAKEHYEAHRLLAIENPDNEKLVYSWWCFANGWNPKNRERYTVTADEYEEAKIQYVKMMSEKNSGENSMFYGRHLFGEDNPHWGKKHSEETKKLLSKLAKQRKVSDETKEKISKTLKSQHRTAWNKGAKLSPEHYAKIIEALNKCCEAKKIPVKQYDLQGKYIQTWPSAADAGKSLGIKGAHITDCCNYKRNLCKNYIWRYECDNSEIEPHIDSRAKEVYQIDENTLEIIAKYKSIEEAARSIGGTASSITCVCNPKYPRKHYRGYIWKYASDVEVHFVNKQEEEE